MPFLSGADGTLAYPTLDGALAEERRSAPRGAARASFDGWVTSEVAGRAGRPIGV